MKFNRFLSIYLIIGFCQLATEIWFPVPSALYFIAKPCIMLSLMIYFWSHSSQFELITRVRFLFGLLFALYGDVMLMLQYQEPELFMYGLGGFLLMQFQYIQHFKVKIHLPKFLTSLPFLAFAAFMLWLIVPRVASGLQIPIVVYLLVITLMGIFAYHRKNFVNRQSFLLVFIGALCFMFSDACIAINKFVMPSPIIQFMIMPTYIIAQYLIVEGVIREKAN